MGGGWKISQLRGGRGCFLCGGEKAHRDSSRILGVLFLVTKTNEIKGGGSGPCNLFLGENLGKGSRKG